ncbi:MAG TPA: YeeE/YedE family protein [Azospirillum sp.]|nr:YeeE/YedE family protein [Azospirillum sp.]
MLRSAAALLAGMLFGLGLAVSGMVNPAKVLGFLDITGRWDPSLALVMAGALAVAMLGFRVALRRPAPLLDEQFALPGGQGIDGRLVTGAALFGVGWGLVGFCPGPAVASLAFGLGDSFTFVAAMFVGMWLYRVVGQSRARQQELRTMEDEPAD